MKRSESIITRSKLEAWLSVNRPDLGLMEIQGQKGFYRRDAGPAFSFKAVGKSWRDVAAHLGMIPVRDA
jgi:hypothetical protein